VIDELTAKYQIIHQTGEGEIARIRFELSRSPKSPNRNRYHPYGFLMSDMGLALAAADLVVGRAGVNTINDCAVLGKPTILIPNYVMAGHQVENARVLSRQGAVRVLDGASLTGAKLLAEVNTVLSSEDEQARLSAGISKFARPEAARELAQLIVDCADTAQIPNSEGAR
jgi:UDP-N-acetylglucosamine--N-acetylmuramyl-(pentapeptide) pyrophosphoryl-undecaprenol N-acetylglucosamine transferase